MSTGNNIKKEAGEVDPDDESIVAIDEKLEELIGMLSHTQINDEVARYFKQQFDHALKNANTDHVHKHELHDEAAILLANSALKKNKLKRYLQGRRVSNIILIVIGIVMMVMGFGMIIMPAPPVFEMFTIYYFNRNDGITIMDLISLLIILAGVYFLIRGIYPNPNAKNKNVSNFSQSL